MVVPVVVVAYQFHNFQEVLEILPTNHPLAVMAHLL
jgi:hypothetical protein